MELMANAHSTTKKIFGQFYQKNAKNEQSEIL